MGVDVELIGPLPTPGIANITTSMRADAGAVISASHNPYQDNGIKFFWRDGFKLPDQTEAELEKLVASGQIDEIRPTADKVGRAVRLDDARGRYIVFLKNTFPSELTLEGLRIVVDCAHGAAYRTAPAVLQELGATVIALACEPNGTNINDGVGRGAPRAHGEGGGRARGPPRARPRRRRRPADRRRRAGPHRGRRRDHGGLRRRAGGARPAPHPDAGDDGDVQRGPGAGGGALGRAGGADQGRRPLRGRGDAPRWATAWAASSPGT